MVLLLSPIALTVAADIHISTTERMVRYLFVLAASIEHDFNFATSESSSDLDIV